MSVCAPTVRGNPAPRWSNDNASGFDPVSMAGLPESNACVCVGPPLLASGPSNGFWPVMLAVFVPKVNPLVTWIRLLVALTVELPRSKISFAPFLSVLFAMIVLARFSVSL
jgi:hypothetical protein